MRPASIVASAAALLPAAMAQELLGSMKLFADDACSQSIGEVDITDGDLAQCRQFGANPVGILFTPKYNIERENDGMPPNTV